MVCDEDRIDYLVNFYSKSNLLSLSIFTVIVTDLVAMPYLRCTRRRGHSSGPLPRGVWCGRRPLSD